MPLYDNEIRVELTATADPSADTEITVAAPDSKPNNLPPDPGGSTAPLVLMDGWYGYTESERITYTNRQDNGDGTYTLTGVIWAQEGTSSPTSWPAGTFIVQDLPASWYEAREDVASGSHSHAWADITDPPAEATRWPDWTEVTGKPATFPPDPHSHTLADVTDSGVLAALDAVTDAEIDSEAAAANQLLLADGAGGVAWGGVPAHTHAWADITNPPAEATRWPTWDEVTSKPSTFPPSAHTHGLADITDSGSMAGQDASAVAITGGTVDGATIGGSTMAPGYFNSLGVGTDAGTYPLYLRKTDGSAKFVVEEANASAAIREMFELSNNGGVAFRLVNTDLGESWSFTTLVSGHFTISHQQTSGTQLRLTPSGEVRITGQFRSTLAGGGMRVVSPDGLTSKIIGIDNSGAIEARDP